MSIKIVLTVACSVTFWLQVKHPELVVHSAVANVAINMIWLWS